jgi:hypothetical protein
MQKKIRHCEVKLLLQKVEIVIGDVEVGVHIQMTLICFSVL